MFKKHSLIYIFLLTFLTFTDAGGQTRSTPADRPKAQPCPENAETRRFDFWVGNWDVTSQGQKIADSKISLIEGNCVVLEQYSQADGYSGESFNFYDPALKLWRQVWVDRSGNISEFSGQYRDGAMYYEGVTYSLSGTRMLRKMTLYNLGPDQVRQLSQRSTDDGQTWNVNYDFLYVRKK